jgi:hypothetical protein
MRRESSRFNLAQLTWLINRPDAADHRRHVVGEAARREANRLDQTPRGLLGGSAERFEQSLPRDAGGEA